MTLAQLKKLLSSVSESEFNDLHTKAFIDAHAICPECTNFDGTWDEVLDLFDEEYTRRYRSEALWIKPL